MSLIEETNSIAYSKSSSQNSNTIINGYEFVDMGLSVKWATCNIGAKTPLENGWYFQWAGTTAYNSDYRAVDDESNIFSWKNTPYLTGDPEEYYNAQNYSKYNETNLDIILEPEDDAAHVHIGDGCRMPTQKEFEELLDNCYCIYNEEDGKQYATFALKSNLNKQITIPFANALDDNSTLTPIPVGLFCWTTNKNNNNGYSSGKYQGNAVFFMARPRNIYDMLLTNTDPDSNDFDEITTTAPELLLDISCNSDARMFGFSIRAVCEK